MGKLPSCVDESCSCRIQVGVEVGTPGTFSGAGKAAAEEASALLMGGLLRTGSAPSCQGPQGTGQSLNYKAALVSKGREGSFDQI